MVRDSYATPYPQFSDDLVSIVWESDKSTTPLGGGWAIETRLPAGGHTITLTLDDGSGPVTDEIQITVSESAPVLDLFSPLPGIEVYSNLPILFDFRGSMDYDGDEFTVSVTSDLMGTILKDRSTELWYNDYLISGIHNLTFELVDEKGMVRTHTQQITVLETGPVSVISGIGDGQYLPPGQMAILTAENSYDYDNDIVLYEWTVDGNVVSNSQILEIMPSPGATRIDLMVKDARGEYSTSSVNITVGSSAPKLSELSISVSSIVESKPTEVVTTVRLEDLDGTTEIVRGEIIYGGVSDSMFFRDDGTSGDEVAGDGIWTSRFAWVVSGGSWVRVEVWAIDGDLVSPDLVATLPIIESGNEGLESWIVDWGIPILLASIAILSILGMVNRRNRILEITKDIEVIEGWSSFDPTEIEEGSETEFNSQVPKE